MDQPRVSPIGVAVVQGQERVIILVDLMRSKPVSKNRKIDQ
jgi:hypothetical protein